MPVPLDTPGVTPVRDLTVFGYHDHQGHCEVRFEGARVPATNLLGPAGAGFVVAQSRLGPGRVHHCMRAIGMSERALELMARRALSRTAFGATLAEQGVVRRDIAESRITIEQLRLLVYKTAWLLDTAGHKGARIEVAAIKAAVPRAVAEIVDRAIQVHGGLGLSGDVPLAQLYAASRALRIADGPDDVHLESVARRERTRVGHVLVAEDPRVAGLVTDGSSWRPSRRHRQPASRLQQAGHGFTARTNALMTLPATCGASRSASRPWEARNSRASSSPKVRVGCTSMLANPAASSLAR